MIRITCPYGNRFLAFGAYPGFGFGSGLGILFAQIDCLPGTAEAISDYYERVFDAETFYEKERKMARVICGDWNQMLFVETETPMPFTGAYFALIDALGLIFFITRCFPLQMLFS